MKLPHLFSFLALFVVSAFATAQQPPIARKDLLSVEIQPLGKLSKVTAQEITFAAGTKAPRHTHPCPVVGTVASGEIAFQVEDKPVQVLTAGSAFYEPANTTITRFDNVGKGEAKFTAFYLCDGQPGPMTQLKDHAP